jgi:hypothetical protein
MTNQIHIRDHLRDLRDHDHDRVEVLIFAFSIAIIEKVIIWIF